MYGIKCYSRKATEPQCVLVVEQARNAWHEMSSRACLFIHWRRSSKDQLQFNLESPEINFTVLLYNCNTVKLIPRDSKMYSLHFDI